MTVAHSLTIVDPSEPDLLADLRTRGFRTQAVASAEISTMHLTSTVGPDAFLIDTRATGLLPRDLGTLRRQFPGAGIVVLARSLDPAGMLEAMRLGITEWLADPVAPADLDAAVQRVARVVTNRATAGKSVAVVGGKGGVGCTTIAVNLAAAIRAATREPTLLVDLHMAQGDTSVFLGVEPRFTVLDALENIHRLDETYFKGLVTPTPSGVDLLASANRPLLGSIDVLRVQALLEFVIAAYPWVVVDCPRSDPSVIDALDVASLVVIVANQELPALRSASRLAALLRQRCGADRVKLAINRFDTESEIGRKDVERVLGGPIDYTFASDYRAAVAALNKGEPLVAGLQGRLAAGFDDAARELAGLPPAARESVKTGLFGRFGSRR
ncbi:MAG: CpaE family protein [Vicinamibacterales bacterium]